MDASQAVALIVIIPSGPHTVVRERDDFHLTESCDLDGGRPMGEMRPGPQERDQ